MSHVDVDVVVIGGGAAGLTAARELHHAGRRAALLEARDRLGGRLWTSEVGGQSIELGGTFVHWFQPHIFAEMTRYGIVATTPPSVRRWLWWSQGRCHDDDAQEVYRRIIELWDRVFDDTYATFPRPHAPLLERAGVEAVDDLSVADRLDVAGITREERDLLEGFLAASCNAPPADAGLTSMMRWSALSGHRFDLMVDAVGIHFIRTADLIDALVADGHASIDVKLESPVASIRQRDSSVTITTRGGDSIDAVRVIVAVPLNALRNIEFDPPLRPAAAQAASEGQSSKGCKVYVRVRGLSAPIQVTAPQDAPLAWLMTMKESGDEQLLVGFGPDAARCAPTDREQVTRAVRAALPGHDIEILAVFGHDWTTDEFALGTWSIPRPGQLTRALEDLQAPFGRVHIAGSDVASGWNGFIDGAIESGLRVAREVNAALDEAARHVEAGQAG
jgi:monoamine oxidase